jgi:hypothetical protein
LCGRCLVNLDARTLIRARFPNGHMEICSSATDPVALKKWAQGQIRAHEAVSFDVDATADRFLPVSTWHGDPVCSWHLWVLADAEMKRGYA